MAKSPKMPYSALLGNPSTGPGGGGTPISRTTIAQPKGTKSGSKTAATNRTPTGRSIAGNW